MIEPLGLGPLLGPRGMPTPKPGQDRAGGFASPSALWEFAIETVSQLRQAGMSEAADLLKGAACYVTSSGWEWLGELGVATASIRKRFHLPGPIASRIKRIHRTATSRRPYG